MGRGVGHRNFLVEVEYLLKGRVAHCGIFNSRRKATGEAASLRVYLFCKTVVSHRPRRPIVVPNWPQHGSATLASIVLRHTWRQFVWASCARAQPNVVQLGVFDETGGGSRPVPARARRITFRTVVSATCYSRLERSRPVGRQADGRARASPTVFASTPPHSSTIKP
ncbi:hypothetical protein EVAR_62739_1 [Eumeta japonica]|uniref:Uncharacterized protein n=1 Tax=Eumeta variegata TaxID=151549 RepID=A0A4C1ZAR5_EUMVA|nr:hypothetical protein EVAR_62739_1 [Eumeta japonica]